MAHSFDSGTGFLFLKPQTIKLKPKENTKVHQIQEC